MLPATSVVSLDLGDDLDAFACLAEDAADVVHVVWRANKRREHDVDLHSQTHTRAPFLPAIASDRYSEPRNCT